MHNQHLSNMYVIYNVHAHLYNVCKHFFIKKKQIHYYTVPLKHNILL